MSALAQMKLLVGLAQVDGTVGQRERNYIVNIGRANGIYPDQIEPLFAKDHDATVPEDLSPDAKFECIYSLVQLMKIDERMYQEEIKFCSSIATRLGYDQHVMFDLMLHVKTSPQSVQEIEALKKTVQKYLKK
jgi:hypothetical protein